jgi:hypothetical protein
METRRIEWHSLGFRKKQTRQISFNPLTSPNLPLQQLPSNDQDDNKSALIQFAPNTIHFQSEEFNLRSLVPITGKSFATKDFAETWDAE